MTQETSIGLETREKEKEESKEVRDSFHMLGKVELGTEVCILVIN